MRCLLHSASPPHLLSNGHPLARTVTIPPLHFSPAMLLRSVAVHLCVFHVEVMYYYYGFVLLKFLYLSCSPMVCPIHPSVFSHLSVSSSHQSKLFTPTFPSELPVYHLCPCPWDLSITTKPLPMPGKFQGGHRGIGHDPGGPPLPSREWIPGMPVTQ